MQKRGIIFSEIPENRLPAVIKKGKECRETEAPVGTKEDETG